MGGGVKGFECGLYLFKRWEACSDLCSRRSIKGQRQSEESKTIEISFGDFGDFGDLHRRFIFGCSN